VAAVQDSHETAAAALQRQVLGRAAQLLASAADFRDTLRQTIGACLPALGDFGFFDVVHAGTVIRTAAAHDAPDIEALLAPTRWERQDREDMNLCALSTGRPALHVDTDDRWYQAVAGTEGHLQLLRQLGFRSMLTVPVRFREELVGALTLFMGRSGRRHDPRFMDFASELAMLAAPVVMNARLLDQHRQLLAAERQARAEAEAARGRLELLAHAGTVLAGSLDPDETLRAIADTLVPGVADWCRIDLLDEQGALQRRLAHHSDPERAKRALEMARAVQAAPATQGSMAWVMETGRSFYGHFEDPQALADPVLSRYTRTFGMGAHFILPLVARGRTIGVMGVVQAESGRDLPEDDRSLIQELGQRAALALDNARLYAEAEAARQQAERANRTKDEFMAMLGHELRNPLAPITTALELMARRNPGANVDERRVIGRQVTHLSRLIDDLMDVSRITQGKIQLRREPVDMKAVVANAVELTRPIFEKRAHPLEVRLPGRRALVVGDAVRLTQVLCNLLVNAGKFTPPDGRVALELSCDEDWVEARVEDTGCGITPDLLPHVFDLFVQGEQAIDRQAGGLGLGLAIVRTLVEMHGGRVEAASAGPGRGSVFSVRLPAGDETPAASPEANDAPTGSVSGRILVVDDNADAAETLAELLRMCGYDVQCAGNGEAAMEQLARFSPQLALLDIGLPGIDGYQLAGMVRRHPAGAGVKLVALTGYGGSNDRARALESGFDEHLVKPVTAERLLKMLDEFAPGPSG
jgi:signal transduction histidine kinase/CheY-like chemotaxis protein